MNLLLFTIAAASKPVPTRAPTNAARPLLYPLLLLSESVSLAVAVACRAAARTRIIVDDGECECHFFVVCGAWIGDVWCQKTENQPKSGGFEVFSPPLDGTSTSNQVQ